MEYICSLTRNEAESKVILNFLINTAFIFRAFSGLFLCVNDHRLLFRFFYSFQNRIFIYDGPEFIEAI